MRGGTRLNRLRFGDDASVGKSFRDGDVTLDAFRVTGAGVVLLVDRVEKKSRHEFTIVNSATQRFAKKSASFCRSLPPAGFMALLMASSWMATSSLIPLRPYSSME